MSASKADLPNDALLADGPLPEPPAAAPDPAPVSRPNVTVVQAVGMIPLVAEAAHAFGVFTMSQAQQDSLSKLVLGSIALFGADAIIRFGRNLAHRR